MIKSFYKASALILLVTALLFSLVGCGALINRDADYTLVEVDGIFDIDTFSANCQNNRFVVSPSPDDSFKLTYYKAEYYPLNHEVEDRTLTLEGKYTKSVAGYVSSKISTVTLFVPESFLGNIDIVTSNGGISLNNLSLNIVDLSTSNGGVKLTNCALEKVNINTSNGKIELNDISAEGKIKLTSSNGALALKNITAAVIDGKTSNGKISLSGVDCADIEMDTSNGRITADILGEAKDYTIFAKTSNGDIYLQGEKIKKGTIQGGEKSLSLITSNGKIEINFSEK